MKVLRMLGGMLVVAALMCSGNLCISASKRDGQIPYSSTTVTLLVEVLKLVVMLAAIVATETKAPARFVPLEAFYYAVPSFLYTIDNNLNYVILRYMDAATLSVLWNLKIVVTAVLFRFVLKHPLSELRKIAIVLLVVGVLTSQSNHLREMEGAMSKESSGSGMDMPSEEDKSAKDLIIGVMLVLVGVTLSSCASVFTEWAFKRKSNCPFLWQNMQMYVFGIIFNTAGVLLVEGEEISSKGFFHGYNNWTLAVVAVNSIGGIGMGFILKYLDNIACVYSHSMAMMLTMLFSMLFFSFSPSLEFGCGLTVLIISIEKKRKIKLSENDDDDDTDTSSIASSNGSLSSLAPRSMRGLQLKKTQYSMLPGESDDLESARANAKEMDAVINKQTDKKCAPSPPPPLVMISRLRLGGAGGNNNNGAAPTSIFGAAASAMSSISGGGSILPGNTSMESAAATAAANHAASTGATGAAGAAGTSSSSDELPPGWRLVSSRNSGRDYYLHIASGQTQWDWPTDADTKRLDTPNNAKAAGGGFFGVSRMVALVNQANKSLQTSLGTTAAPGGKPQAKGQDVDRDGQVVVEIFENERLEGKLQPMDPKQFSDRHAAPGAGQDEKPEGDLPAGHEWVTDWEIDQNYTAVDRDGWTYAADFVEIVRLLGDDLSHASRHPTDAVRRRRWIRYRQPVDDHAPQSPTDSSGNKSLNSSSTSNNWTDATNGQGNDYMLDDNDDPFMRTAQKTQTGFRVNVNFAHRGKKDNTKDYQSISLTDVMWLVNAHDVTNAPSEELMREKTANLEEQIKEATMRSKTLEKDLRSQHDKQTRELAMQRKKFDALVTQYKKIQAENETVQISVSDHRVKVEALRKEATEKDMLANEEQRALNAETAAQNQALEEKAKALATARMRYKRDNKQLAAAVEDAKKRLEQHKAQANVDSHDPVAKDLKTEMERVRQLHAKLEAVRQHRLVVEEESKALFNQVVEKKADLKFKSKQKSDSADSASSDVGSSTPLSSEDEQENVTPVAVEVMPATVGRGKQLRFPTAISRGKVLPTEGGASDADDSDDESLLSVAESDEEVAMEVEEEPVATPVQVEDHKTKDTPSYPIKAVRARKRHRPDSEYYKQMSTAPAMCEVCKKKLSGETVKEEEQETPVKKEKDVKAEDVKQPPEEVKKEPAKTETLPTPVGSFTITFTPGSDVQKLRVESGKLMDEARRLKHEGNRRGSSERGTEGQITQGKYYLRSGAKFFEYALKLQEIKVVYQEKNDLPHARSYGDSCITTLGQTSSLIESTIHAFQTSGSMRLAALGCKMASVVHLTVYRLQHRKLQSFYSEVFTPGRSPETRENGLTPPIDPNSSLNSNSSRDAAMRKHLLKEMEHTLRGFEMWRRFESYKVSVLPRVTNPVILDPAVFFEDLEAELNQV
ncbi:hypothetical protein PHMEG_0009144 [Phytophthora megakarya]|uniref:WW domain-containing protein n=1 Tax=Phytophthora megakarya TaxID=4795 RepID=A0A225WJ02_9STRA|nr:hypothetical protein PHMEG_0009144 [Phytophthora megakarya]